MKYLPVFYSLKARGAINVLYSRLLMLMCVLLGTGLPGFGQSPPELDSLGHEVDSLGIIETYSSLMAEIQEESLNCYPIGISKVVPVLYQNSFSIYVQLADLNVDSVFLSLSGESSQALPILLQGDGAVIIRGLPLQEYYVLSGQNSCGETVPFFSFYTDDQLYSNEEEVVEVVSEGMFKLASAFAAQNSSTALALYDFLNSEAGSGVHPFEKLNFYQQFVMKGERYTTAPQHDLITTSFEKPLPRKDDCECAFVKLAPSASSTAGIMTIGNQQFFKPLDNADGENFSGASNVNKFHWYQTKGAAKNILAYTSGWKADCDKEHSLSANHGGDARQDIDEAEDATLLRKASNYGVIAVSLLCNNGNQLPKKCDCSKKILFDYEYRSELTARAERGNSSWASCNRNRQAAAYADDYVMVTMEQRQPFGETEILALNNFAFGAECGTEINPEWMENFQSVIGELFAGVTLGDVISAISGNGSFGDVVNSDAEIEDIINTTINWLTTDRFLDTPCQTDDRTYGVDNKKEYTLLPNEERWFYIRSSGLVRAEGQRSWQAEARIRSSFAMSIQTFPGSTEEPNVSCCSDWGAAYAGSTLMPGGTDEQINLQTTLERFINGTFETFPDCTLNTPSGPISNGERDVCSVPARGVDCKVPVIERSLEPGNPIEFDPASVREVSLLDVQGRVLHQCNGQNFASFAELEAFLREQITGKDYPAGIYLVRYHDGEHALTQKLFLGTNY